MNAKEIIKAFELFEKEKGIPSEIVKEALKEALSKGYARIHDGAESEVIIDEEAGEIKMFHLKTVVDEVEDEIFDISLKDAKKIKKDSKLEDIVKIEINTDDITRLAAMHAKQVLIQKIKEFEKQSIYDSFIEKKDEIIVGVVERVEENFIIVDLGQTKAILSRSHLLPGENFKSGQAIRVYVVDVDKNDIGAAVIVSRTASGFLKRLFESEIHEVYDGTVEIKKIARFPGNRSKVAVISRNKDVDGPGACIGQRGIRIQKISSQLLGEKIDVIQYYEDEVLFLAEAFKPAEIIGAHIDKRNKTAIVVVNEEDLSLAIGKKGANINLASKITELEVSLKTLNDANKEKLKYKTLISAKKDYEAKLFIDDQKKEEEKLKIRQEKLLSQLQEKEKESKIKEETKKSVEFKNVVEDKKISEERKANEPEIKVVLKEKKELKPKTTKPLVKKPFTKVKKIEKDEEKQDKNAKKLEELIKKRDAARSYMPVYSEDELKEIEEINDNEEEEFDVDYENYDEYYDEE